MANYPSVNKTYSVQRSLTLTPDQATNLDRIAKDRGVSARALVRALVDNLIRNERYVWGFTPQLQQDLQTVAQAQGVDAEQRITTYVMAGVAHDMAKLGITPTVQED